MTRDLDALRDLAGMIRERALADFAKARRARRVLEDERRTFLAAARAAPILDPEAPNGLAAARAEAHGRWARSRARGMTPAIAQAAAAEEAARVRAARALGRASVIGTLGKTKGE